MHCFGTFFLLCLSAFPKSILHYFLSNWNNKAFVIPQFPLSSEHESLDNLEWESGPSRRVWHITAEFEELDFGNERDPQRHPHSISKVQVKKKVGIGELRAEVEPEWQSRKEPRACGYLASHPHRSPAGDLEREKGSSHPSQPHFLILNPCIVNLHLQLWIPDLCTRISAEAFNRLKTKAYSSWFQKIWLSSLPDFSLAQGIDSKLILTKFQHWR